MINPLSNPSYLLPPLIAGCVIIGLLVFVWQKSRRDFSSKIFCGLLLSFGLWSFLTFGMRFSPDVYHALPWEKALIVAGAPAFVLYYHFTFVYTNVRRKKWIIPAIYSFLVAFGILVSTTDLAIKGMSLEHHGYAPITGPIGFLIFAPLPLLVAGGAYNLLKSYRASSSSEERNRLLYLAIAAVFPILGVGLDGFTNLPPAAIWGNLIFCIICTVAIVKYHLLDIRIVVRKSLVYLLISGGIAIPYVSLLYLLNYILEPKLGPWWIHALVILLLAIILRPLYSSAQQLADRLFYRDRYDALRALQQFGGEAQSVVNLEELGSNMVQLVSSALRTSSACLLLPSVEKRGLVIISSTGLESPPSGVVLRVSSPLVKWLELHGDILSAEQLNVVPQLQSFSLKEKNNLERMGAKIYIPMKTRQGQLSGILVLGQKLSQQSYSGEDEQLLTALTVQMGMALENARLYKETRESERVLRESEEFSSSLLNNSPNPMLVINPDTSVRYVNPTLERLTGFSSAEIIGTKSPYPLWTEEKLQKTTRDLKEAMRKGAGRLEELFQKKNGERFWVEITSTPVIGDGELKYYLVNWVDITERKQAEERERQLQQELYLSSRLASIGELAAGVAHEINNPLTGILGFSQRLLRKSTDEKVSLDLARIHNEALRAAKVVENLLTFARRRQPKRDYSDINDIMQKILELRDYELKTGNIEVELDLAPSLRKIIVDSHQIQEVFLNIILNTEQAMTEASRGGKLTIKTQETKGYIRITFTDDGPGIAAAALDKLFDPFFTTREEKGGTGLGLSISHGIVTKHGGKIYARSKLGEGTTFFIELPLTTEKIAEG